MLTPHRLEPGEYAAWWEAGTVRPAAAYDSPAFTALNAQRLGCQDQIHHVGLRDASGRLRACLTGRLDPGRGVLRAPFSAPFAAVEWRGRDLPGVSTVTEALDALRGYCRSLGARLSLTLPPSIHQDPVADVMAAAAVNAGGWHATADYDYYRPLGAVDAEAGADPCLRMSTTGAQKYRQALRHPGAWDLVSLPAEQLGRAYAIIAANRRAHGYPLAMTEGQVSETLSSGGIRADVYVLTHAGDGDVAAALVYAGVTPGVSQVIYWGDAPGHASLRPMNMLAAKVFQAQAAQGVAVVDVGPASQDGVPNHGLCDFKLSIGCLPCLRWTLEG